MRESDAETICTRRSRTIRSLLGSRIGFKPFPLPQPFIRLPPYRPDFSASEPFSHSVLVPRALKPRAATEPIQRPLPRLVSVPQPTGVPCGGSLADPWRTPRRTESPRGKKPCVSGSLAGAAASAPIRFALGGWDTISTSEPDRVLVLPIRSRNAIIQTAIRCGQTRSRPCNWLVRGRLSC